MPAWLARSYLRSTAEQEVAGSILRSGISFCGNCDSSRATVGSWQKDGHFVLMNGLEVYPGTVWLGAPTVSKMT